MKNHQDALHDPLVSVICITYNHEAYIHEAIESFLSQETSFPFEILIGEDCSTDNTAKIVNSYQDKFPNIIKATTRDSNDGTYGKSNLTDLINKSKGKYIALCEGDDIWSDSQKLQTQIEEMQKYPAVEMSFHGVYYLDHLDSSKGFIKNNNFKGKNLIELSTLIGGSGSICATPSLMFKRSVLDNLPDWFLNENTVVGDYYLQIFGAIKYPALFIDKAMCTQRCNVPASWTDMQRKKSLTIRLEEIEIRLRDNRRLKKMIPNKYLYSLNLKYSKLLTSKVNILLQLKRFKEAKKYLKNIEHKVIKLNKKLYLLFLLKHNLGLINRIMFFIRKIRQE